MDNGPLVARAVFGGVLLAAAFAVAVAALMALWRFPDAFTRARAFVVIAILAAPLALAGLAVLAWRQDLTWRFLLLGLLLQMSAPAIAQAIGAGAYAAGLAPLTGRYTAPRPGGADE